MRIKRIITPRRTQEVNQFLVRTSGITPTHANAYTRLINSLSDYGVWGKLDAFYIFATNTTGNAILNLKSSSYTATLTGSPTFTADRGYTGNGVSSFVDSNFNPTTATSPKYVQDSACIFGRCLNSVSNTPFWGDTGGFKSNFYPLGGGGIQAEARVNSSGSNIAVAETSCIGFWSITRSGAAAQELYKNGASIGSNTSASTTMQNANLSILRTQTAYATLQAASYGFGQHLTAGEQIALRDAELAYMQTVGAV